MQGNIIYYLYIDVCRKWPRSKSNMIASEEGGREEWNRATNTISGLYEMLYFKKKSETKWHVISIYHLL